MHLNTFSLEGDCPLNESQLNVYLNMKDNNKPDSYFCSYELSIPKKHSIDDLSNALNKVIEAHPILKMHLSDEFDVHLVKGDYPPILIESDVSDDFVNEFISKHFDSYGSLCRFLIIENINDYSLFAVFHNLIFDDFSKGAFKHDLLSCLNGKSIDVDDSFLEISAFNHQIYESDEYEKAKEFYEVMLSDIDEAGVLLEDCSFEGQKILSIPLDKSIGKNLGDVNVKESVLFTGAFAYTLSRFVGSNNVVFNFVDNGRDRFSNYNSIGMFSNVLPLLVECTNRDIKSFMDYVSDTLDDVARYNFYPFRLLDNDYDINSNIIFKYTPDWFGESDGDLSDIEENIADSTGVLFSDFSVNVVHKGNDFTLNIMHSARYSENLVERFAYSYNAILSQMLTADNLCDIDYICDNDLMIMNDINQTESPLKHDDLLDAFNDNLADYPDNNLVSMNDRRYTYGEGAFIADKIAKKLAELGVKPQDCVSFLVDRSEEYMFCILGIMSMGGVYVPLDDAHPNERIRFMIKDTESKVIIVSDETYDRTRELSHDFILLNISNIIREDIGTLSSLPVVYGDLACILYTSGTTGLPKGVKVTRKSILNVSAMYCDTYSMSNDEVYGLFSAIGFDGGSLAITISIYSGACLSIVPDNIKLNIKMLNEYFINQGVTHTMITTQVGKLFMQSVESTSLKVLLVGGEKLGDFESPEKYLLVDGFGPTEAFAFISSIKNSDKMDSSSIGFLNYNTKAYILDDEARQVPIGAVGELYLAGYQIADGYLNREEENLKSFIENPFENDGEYSRLYRTGDMVRLLPDGSLGIVGRRDSQVKIRGNRVELSEIESLIREIDYVEDVTVQAVVNGSNHELVAYVVVGNDETNVANSVKGYVGENKPSFMVPSFVVMLDEIPLNVNGKVDRHALPQPTLELENVVPKGRLEEKLFEIASSIANTDDFGVTDDLYAVGFASLSLMQFNASIYKNLGVNLDISELLNTPTIRSIAKQIEDNKHTSIDLTKYTEKRTYYPLTPNQYGVYYECVQNFDEAQYNLPSLIRFDSTIDAEKLKESIIKTIETYPYIKTRIVMMDGELFHKRDDSIAIDDIPIVEVDSISNKEIEKENVKKFDLLNDQLFRVKIYKTPEETILFFDIHHIITDGESVEKLFNNFIDVYHGREIEEEIIDGYVNALLEEENKSSQKYAMSEKYFKDQLSRGVDTTILTPNLNGDYKKGKLGRVSVEILPERMREFCSNNRISPNVLFMAATVVTLNKYTFSDKILISTIFNARLNSNYFNTRAFLVKTLPIVAINENRNITIRELLKQIDKTWKGTIEHCNYPYTEISKTFDLKPQFMYSYNHCDDRILNVGDKNYRIEFLESLETNYKITFDVNETQDFIELLVLYNDQLYTKEYIKTFLSCIVIAIRKFFTEDIDKLRICDIELIREYELPTFTPVETPFIHKRFEKQVDKKPDDVALVASDATLTYAELNEKANRIANGLINKGIKAQSNILVMLPRTSDLIASILGILKAGCAFIPIDLEYPKDRINYIYENSQANYILSAEKEDNSINVNELLEEKDSSNPNVEITPDDLAYMIYTSGSTGNPKGVMISHENICNQVQNPKSEHNRLLCLATISFDVSLDDILTSLSNGLKLILASDTQIKNVLDLIELIDEEKPEILEITPSRLASYLELDKFRQAISCIKVLFLGGEQFPVAVFENFRKCCDAKVYNSYGPTETTITSNNKEITDVGNITVGLPLDNYVTEVRDIDGKLLPDGVMGELYIGGVSVGKGYYNMPEKTQEVFLTINNIPYYRSGDYAICLPNGEIDIKGRIDNQIKLRGLRIEIGEIESDISNFQNIKRVVVVIKEIQNNEHLCAYFTAENEIDTDKLKEYLSKRLTQYMVPTVFVQIDEMPQTPNGKIDLKQLPKPVIESDYIAPETELEQRICMIYSTILDLEFVSVEANFFEIGGTSLLASKLIIELLKENYKVKYEDIFKNQTPRKLANFILGESDSSEDEDNQYFKNYDYTKIDKLLSENTLENFSDGESRPLGDVLLTGVTGFLGIHILYEYIKNEDGKIYCLLRKGQFDSIEERMCDLMDYYFDEDLSYLIGNRIILIEGDIINPDSFKKFEDYPIDTLINSAAIVKHFAHDDYIFRVNVDGVIRGLDFAEANDIRYIQLSTISTIDVYNEGTDISDVKLDERTFYWGQDLSNPYVKSKFLAEKLVLERALSGMDVKIIRLGNLMARHFDGIFQINFKTNAFLNNIKSIAKLQAINHGFYQNMVEFSPIDYVAKAVLLLSKTPEESRIFHCESDKLIPLGDVINVLNSYGHNINLVSTEEFKKIFKENMDDGIQGLVMDDLSIDDHDLGKNDEVPVDMNLSLNILASLGFEWPKCDETYLRQFINHLNDFNYFD